MNDTESALHPRVDWRGIQRPASSAEVSRAEVAEIRTAVEQLTATGDAFDAAVAAFLAVQATMLERAGGTPQRADSMRREEDALDDPDTFPSPARSALLIARARLGKG